MTPQLVPAPTRHALLAVLAYAAAVLCILAWVLTADSAARDLRAVYDLRSEMLEGLKKHASTNRSADLSPTMQLDAVTVTAPSETVAAGALQRYLLERLESAGGLVQSVQAEPRRETVPPGLHRLSAQLAFDASASALQRFLFELETGLPFVFVDALAAQPTTAVQPGTRAGDTLRVTLTVTGYWKAGGER